MKPKKNFWELLNTPVQELFPSIEAPVLETAPVEAAPPLTESGPEPIVEEQKPAVPHPIEEIKQLEADLPEEAESDWFSAFKDKLQFGLGREKPRLSEQEKTSWLQKFSERLSRTRNEFVDSLTRLTKGRTKVDEDLLEELEEILLQSDIGLDTTEAILAHLKAEAKQRRFLPEEILPSLTAFLSGQLTSEPFQIQPGRLNIFLVVGVNGTGKTTTVGKIAAKLKISGYKVMLAAADTFRAAAIDQLEIWGKRVNVPVIRHQEGADAGAVAFDAIQAAKSRKIDVLLIDTAGRLHNKDHLMAELQKIDRIVRRVGSEAHIETLLVLDSTTGQNGLRQAEVFSAAIPINGLILTKLDGTAKGGVIFGIKQSLGIPIKLIGVGEHLDDLQEFTPELFVEALFMEYQEAR